jgi:hypothetical protein
MIKQVRFSQKDIGIVIHKLGFLKQTSNMEEARRYSQNTNSPQTDQGTSILTTRKA